MSEINELGRGGEIKEIHEMSLKEEPKLEDKKVMVDIVCSYCGKILGQKESFEQKVTHSVCQDCFKKMSEEIDNEVI